MTLDNDDRLDDLLRTLDPAAGELETAANQRADALLARILTTPPGEPLTGIDAGTSIPAGAAKRPAFMPIDPAMSSRRHRRWLVLPAAAATLVAAWAALPSLLPVTPAYATWTSTPTPVTGPAYDKTVGACQKAMASSADRGEGPYRPDPRAETARTVLAEQRGQVILVSLISDNDSAYSCMFDAARPGRPHSASGGIATVSTPSSPPLDDDQLRSLGPGMSGGPEGGFAHTQGRVGADVRTVTIHSSGMTLEASVTDGVFAAWWPISGSFEEPMIMDIRFDVTLADGRVLMDVPDGMNRGPRPGPREIGRVQRGGGASSDGDVSTAGGLVGSEVREVTVHADGRATPAEVADGTFRAKWSAPKGSADAGAASGPSPATYTLTLRDGTVLPHVRPISGADS